MTLPGESRADLLARVRAALEGGSSAPHDPPEIDAALVRTVDADGDLPRLFAQRAVAVGMTVHRVFSSSVAGALTDLLRQFGARTAAIGASDPVITAWIDTALAEAGVERATVEPSAGLRPCFDSDVGISDVAAAIAEAGTLVYACDPAHPRGVCIAPPIHIAIVRAEQILADLIDLHTDDRLAQLPASLLYITGPSKTADIEGELVTGVHGPREVHVLLVDDAPATPA